MSDGQDMRRYEPLRLVPTTQMTIPIAPHNQHLISIALAILLPSCVVDRGVGKPLSGDQSLLRGSNDQEALPQPGGGEGRGREGKGIPRQLENWGEIAQSS